MKDDNSKLYSEVSEMKFRQEKLKDRLIKNKQDLTILKYHNTKLRHEDKFQIN